MSVPALRFKEFSDKWMERKLGDLCSSFKSGAGITSEKINDSGDYPVYGGNGLRGFTNTFTHDGFYLLIGRQGALCGNINRSYGKAYISEHAIAVSGNILSDTSWLAYKLDYLQLNRFSESSAQPGLSVNKLVKLEFAVPAKPEQTKIANFLTAVDEKITHLTQKQDLLTQYKKGVMQQIFSQELRFKDDDGRDFPEWEKKQLGDVVNVMQSGVSRMLNDSDIGLPVIRSNNLIDNKLDISDIKYWYSIDNQGVNLENYFLKDGDLLVNFINSLAQIGKVALFENLLNRNTIFTTNLMRLSFKSNVNTKYIACFFQTNDYIQHIQAITKPAVNQASFTTKEFKTLVIPFPSKSEQTKIANFLTAIDDKITATKSQLEAVKQYKQGLLQQMFV